MADIHCKNKDYIVLEIRWLSGPYDDLGSITVKNILELAKNYLFRTTLFQIYIYIFTNKF